MSGVLQGSILAPKLFNIFFSDMGSETECTFNKSANDTKLCGAEKGCYPESHWKAWKGGLCGPNKVQQEKCKVLHVGWDNPKLKYRLRGE